MKQSMCSEWQVVVRELLSTQNQETLCPQRHWALQALTEGGREEAEYYCRPDALLCVCYISLAILAQLIMYLKSLYLRSLQNHFCAM